MRCRLRRRKVRRYKKPGLTVRQNKHVLRVLMRKGAPQKSGHMTIYFIRQTLG
jgi:hypothetical protein